MTTPIRDAFLHGMSRAAQTVTIVTTDGPAGRAGVTVSAMVSVSADTPQPTLLVCIHHTALAAARILENATFCVNVLRDDQSYVADIFAGRHKGRYADKFDCASWTPMPLGAPRLIDPLVAFDCKLGQHSRIGTHHVLMGDVQTVFTAPHGTPLLYAQRAYGKPTRLDTGHGTRDHAPSGHLTLAVVSATDPALLPALLRDLAPDGTPDLTLIEGDTHRALTALRSGEADMALLYDIDLPPEFDTVPLQTLAPYILLAADHPLAGHAMLPPAALSGHPMVLLNTPPLADHALTLLRSAGVTPRIAWRATSVDMVRGMVGQGLGYAVLTGRPAPRQACDGTPLIALPFPPGPHPAHLVLATRRGAPLPPLAERLIDIARSHFAPDA